MPKRRTRSQKVAANHSFTYKLSHVPAIASPPDPTLTSQPSFTPTSVSVQFPKLIAFDLVKTIAISTVIFAIQIGLYIFWR